MSRLRPVAGDAGMTWEILTGDCRDLLAQLPAGSVHTVVTSPPYLLAYLGGIVDGEGYIGVKRTAAHPGRVTPGHHARISVKMNDPAPAVRLLHATFGGRCAPENGRTMLCWQVTDLAAERTLRQLLPYLLVKREQAENALALRELQAASRQHRTKVIGTRRFPNAHGTERNVETRTLSDEYIAACDEHWLRGKSLNGRG